MAGNVINKMMGILGMDDELEDFDESQEIEDENEIIEEVQNDFTTLRNNNTNNRKGKIVSINNNSARVVIKRPTQYEDALEICEEFKNRKIVVINTTQLDANEGQKLLDFVAGASYITGGDLQKVENGIYLLSPSNVQVDNALKSEISSSSIFKFTK